MLVLGLDGCGDGWLAVALRGGAFHSAMFVPSVERALEAHASAEVVAIDIPIGAEADRTRTVDGAARKLLGPRGSTLFQTPPAKVLRRPTFDAALALCRKLTGKGLSRQAYALREKILEVEPVAARDGRIIEVHPELCFRALASGTVLPRKKSWNGLVLRRRLLEGVGIHLPDALGEAGERAAPDDVVDAAAAAWTAERRRRGVAERIGGPSGRGPAIWF
jgi:predicted RNase H-like nuclease